MIQASSPSELPLAALAEVILRGNSALVRSDASEALRELRESGETARLVLIDPPYNRRTKFHHYRDSQNREVWLATLREHCSALQDLLTQDGSLWMHIDDAEVTAARSMLDDLFGARNFLATIVWQKSASRDNRMHISTTHEYVLAYAKDKRSWARARHKLPATPAQLGRYSNPDDDPRGPWMSGDLTAKAGPGRRAAQFYDLATPSGRVVRPTAGTAWRYTRDRLEELIADDRIDFGSGDKMPRLKRFLVEVEAGLVPDTWWSGDVVGTADSAKRHLKALFPNLVPFETPKPEELAARVIHISTDPGDLIVDVYGGSGTTAAVAHKMGRRFLVVEREERTFREFTLPRLDKVVEGDDPGGVTAQMGWIGGGQFNVLVRE